MAVTMNTHPEEETVGISPRTLAVSEELRSRHGRRWKTEKIGGATLETRLSHDSLWAIVRRPEAGGFALRTACSPGSALSMERRSDRDGCWEFDGAGAVGAFRVRLETPAPGQPLLRCRVWLTPASNLTLDHWPRDLYPLGAGDNPVQAGGRVHAAQRGLNCGIVYLTLSEPAFGSVLYFQNLTALNPYFLATGTIPDGCVGGRWPELGCQLPVSPDHPLPAGQEMLLSDVFLHWSEQIPQTSQQSSRLFLDLLAGVYAQIDRPDSLYHDWPRRAKETLRDLEHSPKATLHHYGHRYLHPYTDAEYPDSMVQLTTLMPIREYANWMGTPIPLADELRAGVGRFFDADLGTVRRYLPNVGTDKDADEVDSWYLYHPLANLGRLALEGDAEAREMFLAGLEFGIKVAHRFHYQWPVQFNVRTLDVITGPRSPGEPGQSDAGGLFAYAAIQAFELTGKNRYLTEAKKAIDVVRNQGFEIGYQTNITAWAANACLRLWRLTGDEFFRDESLVFLASFFHNSLIWESEIGNAKHYPIFLGATCLHDGPYMAMYECFESFASFHEYLCVGGEDLPDSVRLLLSEYCRYALSRAWFYYPQELPKEALATEVRNGHIERALAFPLEDLYGDGQPAGQVGQEIYGSGAAFAFTTRAYHRLKHAAVTLYCEYPVFALEEREGFVTFQVRGRGGYSCHARLMPTGRTPLPPVKMIADDGTELTGEITAEGHCAFVVPAGRRIELHFGVQ